MKKNIKTIQTTIISIIDNGKIIAKQLFDIEKKKFKICPVCDSRVEINFKVCPECGILFAEDK